jgi:hypothetical protein
MAGGFPKIPALLAACFARCCTAPLCSLIYHCVHLLSLPSLSLFLPRRSQPCCRALQFYVLRRARITRMALISFSPKFQTTIRSARVCSNAWRPSSAFFDSLCPDRAVAPSHHHVHSIKPTIFCLVTLRSSFVESFQRVLVTFRDC